MGRLVKVFDNILFYFITVMIIFQEIPLLSGNFHQIFFVFLEIVTSSNLMLSHAILNDIPHIYHIFQECSKDLPEHMCAIFVQRVPTVTHPFCTRELLPL